jgi:hypothetical protein
MQFQDALLFLHPTFGVLATVAAVWVLVETLNASEANRQRLNMAGWATAILFALTWFFAGWFYTIYYHSGDQMIIENGPVPWAHSFFMEAKEHLFFTPLILAFLLPFLTRLNLATNKSAKTLVLTVTLLIALSGLAIEGAGAVINWGAKTALAETAAQVTPDTTTDAGAKSQ